jgi:hypothetical protein
VSGPANSIEQVPLSDVLPRDFAAAADRLRRLSRELESHPRAAGRTQWHWYPEHSAKPADSVGRFYHLVFDVTITLFDEGYDSLELALDVSWHPDLTVNAAVQIACWCPEDHGIHHVRDSRRPVGGADELVEAYAAGVAMLVGVLDSGPFDPGPWRREAGLPAGRSETG